MIGRDREYAISGKENGLHTVVWDFNGTLLDDMQVCIDCMNVLLGDRSLPPLEIGKYRDIFTFPVKDYYIRLGFDFTKEPFEIPAHQFIDLYRDRLHRAPLHQGTEELLEFLARTGVRQFILSAMEQDFLEETIRKKGIAGFFHRVVGIRDHLANGKLEMAQRLSREFNLGRQGVYLVGDTLHDQEVALGSGIPCILVADGHQSYERLAGASCIVLKDLNELQNWIVGQLAAH